MHALVGAGFGFSIFEAGSETFHATTGSDSFVGLFGVLGVLLAFVGAAIVVFNASFVVVAYLMVRRRRWARVAVIVLTSLSLALDGWLVIAGLSGLMDDAQSLRAWAWWLGFLLLGALDVMILVALGKPASRHFFGCR